MGWLLEEEGAEEDDEEVEEADEEAVALEDSWMLPPQWRPAGCCRHNGCRRCEHHRPAIQTAAATTAMRTRTRWGNKSHGAR